MPTTKRRVDTSGPDFYPTEPWATHALMQVEAFEGNIWEPACGDGRMAEVLKLYGHRVFASDLHDRGYGRTGVDFLGGIMRPRGGCANVVTNPPYNLAQAFVERGLQQATGKVAMLLRLAFLEGAHRAATLYRKQPPTRVHVFSERLTFYPKGRRKKGQGSGTTAYAWFVWEVGRRARPTELLWLEPGLKANFSE